MASDDEKIRLLLDLIGFESVDKAIASMGHLKGAAGQTQQGLDELKKSTVNVGLAGQEAGRIFQDVIQGGIGGGLNNIERMVTFLGGGAGLAGALTALGVTLFIFKDQIRDVFEFFKDQVDGGKGKLEALHDKIKEIEAQPVKLAVDVLELENARKEVERIKEALAAAERLRKLSGGLEKESGQQINENIAESAGGGQAVRDVLRQQFVRELEAGSGPLADARRRRGELDERIGGANAAIVGMEQSGDMRGAGAARAQLERLQKEREKAIEEARKAYVEITKEGGAADAAYGSLFGAATTGTGDVQRKAQAELARRLRAGGMGGLATGVAASSPEELLRQYEQDDAFDKAQERMKEGVKARAKANKRIEDLNVTGIGNQEASEAVSENAAEALFKTNTDRWKRFDRGPADAEGGAAKAARDMGHAIDAWIRSQAFKPDTALDAAEANRIRAMTGATPEASAAMGKRSNDLQAQGWNANQAQQQAYQEILAAMHGMGQQYQQLQQFADRVTAEIRRYRQQFGNAAGNMSHLNFGGP